jgi:hypothetical protein
MSVLGAGIALGIGADLLLRETPWGLNWALWAACLGVAAVVAARIARFEAPRAWPWLLAVGVLFSTCLAWRASPVLAALDLAAAGAAVAIAAGALRSGVTSYAVSGAMLAAETIAGPFPAATEIEWKDTPSGRWSGHAGAAARGFGIALPLLFVFGGLFAAADAVFEGFARNLFDVEDLSVHVIVIVLGAWIACGVVHHLLTRRAPVTVPVQKRLGAVEVGVVLGLLNLLFLVFVLVQLRYLFGGNDHVLETTGLTYSEYARRGFFELVAVAALAVPLVLLGDSLARPRRLFRGLTVVLVALLAVIMVSAVERMRLYTDAYGLTQLRLYTLAFLFWLAVVVVWMLATVLRDRHSLFMPGALVAGLAAVAVLNALNPDALIARTNIDRHLEGRQPLDTYYLGDLSADATPTILSHLDDVPRAERRFLVSRLEGEADDWRSWSLSRSRAQDALDDYARSVAAASR